MENIIRHQFSFPHPAETVWDYLTNPRLLELWLMKNDFKLELGHEFQFRTGPVPSLNFDGICYCKVLEIVPNQYLSYSWNCGPGNGEITLESVVKWTLTPTDKGTDVSLVHSGFDKKENLEFYNGLLLGWTVKLEKIANLLNTEKDADANT